MLFEGVTVGHSGDVIGNRAGGLGASRLHDLALPFRRQGLRSFHEVMEHILNYPARFRNHPIDPIVPIHALEHKRAQGFIRRLQRGAEGDERVP